ncbi:unnamed protein product [Eruca vesicaria subsp. sativa]|uniref:MADS-box domain-containing protein n=1 Tax=Eruca vesicaria subsp. sativa TaxID=29727 RepID=A0ABC8IPJ8_ERUVS|nr:unnamed protein product [Eruca vesicaria subsp. sativa]
MEKVQDTNTKQVTFSKRRSGLFKKAAEIATLCNAENVITTNPKTQIPVNHQSNGRGNRARHEKRICKRLNSIMEQVEAVKKRGEDFQNQLEPAGEEKFDKPIEELSLEELKEYEDKMMNRHGKIQSNISQMQVSSTLMLLSIDTQNN